MLVVETIGRIRREHLVKGKSIKEIARDLKMSRNAGRGDSAGLAISGHSCSLPRTSFPILREQQVQQVLAYVKIGRLEGRNGGRKIHQSALRGTIKNAQCSHYGKSPGARRGCTSTVVNKYQVKVHQQRQCNCCAFTRVQRRQLQVFRDRRRRHDSKPSRPAVHPCADRLGSVLATELVANHLRHHDRLEQLGE
jgi:hypothetical protein